jgi:hypothetical protein
MRSRSIPPKAYGSVILAFRWHWVQWPQRFNGCGATVFVMSATLPHMLLYVYRCLRVSYSS